MLLMSTSGEVQTGRGGRQSPTFGENWQATGPLGLTDQKGNIMPNMYTDLEVRVRDFARSLRRDEGATAVEYGLMVALIAVVIIAAVALLGGNVADTFSRVASTIG